MKEGKGQCVHVDANRKREIVLLTSLMSVNLSFTHRRRRHRSDPPTVDVNSPLLHHQNPQLSLSVGVSPASVAAAPVDVSRYSALEEEVRTKLESSLKKEKALSRRYGRSRPAMNLVFKLAHSH